MAMVCPVKKAFRVPASYLRLRKSWPAGGDGGIQWRSLRDRSKDFPGKRLEGSDQIPTPAERLAASHHAMEREVVVRQGGVHRGIEHFSKVIAVKAVFAVQAIYDDAKSLVVKTELLHHLQRFSG
jgi:hypothetical protein